MHSITKISKTAAIMVAVFSCLILATGCATHRQAEEIKNQIAGLETRLADNQQAVTTLANTISAESEGSRKMRADLAATVDDLQRQIAALLENYNDLMEKLNKISQQPRTVTRIESSPGATTKGTHTDTGGAPQTSGIDCAATYDEAFIAVRRNEYDKAIAGFKNFIENCPKHDLAENAHYWLGESFYLTEKYKDAIAEFDFLLDNFKTSGNTSRALYKLGRSHQELGSKKEAKKVFQRIVDEHPGTLEAEQAAKQIKELK
jgi:tol-pal system protein YbgF